MENNQELSTINKTSKKEEKKVKKLNRIYSRKYSERRLKSRLLKKVFVPEDKEFVKNFLIEETNKKNKKYFYFDKTKITDKKDIRRLNRIAKEVRKQKARVRIIPILAIIAIIAGLVFCTYLFRNKIARKIVVNSSQSIFGAKCDVKMVDFNLWNTRFQIRGYAVANKNKPMRNLFEIENIDIYFNLLELTRGKFVAENIAVESITWNTERKTSGALPLRKAQQKKESSNPVMKLVNNEIAKVKNEVSFSNGLSALREKTDPKLILEREIKNLQSPKMKDEIIESSKILVHKWKDTTETSKRKTKDFIYKAKALVETDVNNFKNPKEIADFIIKIGKMIKLSKENIEYAENLTKEVKADYITVKNLAIKTKSAIERDFNRITELANKINDIRLGGAEKFISSLLRIFYIESLGKYYPKIMTVLEYAKSTQSAEQKEEDPSLKDKAFKLERLKGRNVYFSNHSMPSIAFKNIKLSIQDPKDRFKIAGNVKNASNNADQLNRPTEFSLKVDHGKMSEQIIGIIDLRTKEKELLNLGVDFNGLEVFIDPEVDALPKMDGILHVNTNLNITKRNDVRIITGGSINEANITANEFEPEFIYNIYSEILSEIKTVDLETKLEKNKDERLKLDVRTTVDEQIAKAMQKQIAKELAKIRKKVIEEGNKYLDIIEKEYSNEISEATGIYGTAREILNDSKNTEKILKKKLKEAERQLKKLAGSKVNEVTDELGDQVKDIFKGFF